MKLNLKYTKTPSDVSDAIIAFTDDKLKLSDALLALDKNLNGFISDTLKKSAVFTGKANEVLSLNLPKNDTAPFLIIIGLGTLKDITELDMEKAGAGAAKPLESLKIERAVLFTDLHTTFTPEQFAAHIAHGLTLRAYGFDKYRPAKDTAPQKPTIVNIDILTSDPSAAKKYAARLDAVAKGTYLARDLVNEAPNVLYPESYADIIKKELAPLGVKVDILDEKKMEKLGMGAILAVGMGSIRPPRLVIMRWNGSGKAMKKPLAFVGKGVTFDTGGISLKPGAGMDEMKMDMGGSAAVIGLMKALALQKSKTDVVAIVGLAENMPSDRAYRPGDIVKSYNGKYIEVLNTDAEGRLVLVDCLSYIQEKFDPALIVDLATLTGAIMVALASEYSGVFANDDTLWNGLNSAGTKTGEKVWRMPLDEVYRKDVESDIGAVRNLAKNGRLGGACTAAAFLEHFVDTGRIWAHIDIAGTAWLKSDTALSPKGATGVGVRLLESFVKNHR